MSTFRAAVVGCGGRSRDHILAYEHLDDAEIVACCDLVAERREQTAEAYGLQAFEQVADMLEHERPDIVHLVTRPDTRVELMSLVSERGVPLCTVEKPVATEVRDWRALGELQAATGTRFAVCHQFRWHPHVTACRRALREGGLGDVRFLDFSCGMNVTGQGTHILNYARSLVGDSPVTGVFGSAHGWDTRDLMHPGPAATEAYVVFDNGVRGLWTTGSIAPRCGDPGTAYQHVRVAAFADRGRVGYEEFGRWEIEGRGGHESGAFGGEEQHDRNNLAAQAGLYRAMFDWLRDADREPGTSLRHALHEWKAVLALYASALNRAPVDVPSFHPDDDLVARYRASTGL